VYDGAKKTDMKHLFSKEGEKALLDVLEFKPLLALDFDGTLAPIVARPESARVSATVALGLKTIGQYLQVAIISGRRIDDLRQRVGFEPNFIIGNHGTEDPQEPASEQLALALDPLRHCLQQAQSQLQGAEVTVEDKHYSLALHYRLAHDRPRALEVINTLLSQAGSNLHVFGGKLVVNVMAPAAPDKADAIWRLVRRLNARSAIFVGDDLNDEPVFQRADPHWLTVKVGRDNPRSQAQFCLDHAQEVGLMLDKMAAALSSTR
jgi:trehalose 6-phosphate phosphatase